MQCTLIKGPESLSLTGWQARREMVSIHGLPPPKNQKRCGLGDKTAG